MTDLIRITALTEQLGISSRSLRYYEQVGLIHSVRPDNEKYRFFDAENIERLKQIQVLRKMQIPIKDILHIYESKDASVVVETFVKRLAEIDAEIDALSELKRIVDEFLQTMMKYGVKQITALPLLYEEMERQLESFEEQRPITYDDLSAVNEKLVKPVDVRIIMLPEMRVLTSYMKSNNRSDIDAFWQWINAHHIDYGTPGSHTLFEQEHNDELVMIVKIANDYNNTSPFIDRNFNGGLFATESIYIDDDINLLFRKLLKSFDDNKYYEIDYTHDGKLRDEPLVEAVISPDELRSRIDIFVPVKKRLADIANYKDEKQAVDEITLSEMKNANPTGQIIPVELKAMDSIGTRVVNNDGVSYDYKFFDYNEFGEIELHSYLLARQLASKEKIKIPFIIELVCQIPHERMEVRICHGVGYIEISFLENNIQIIIREPIFGDEQLEHRHITQNNIIFGEETSIKWVIGEKYFSVIVNDEVKYCGKNFAYMQINRNTFKEHPVRVAAAHAHDSVIIKSIKLYPVLPEKNYKLKKGELRMVTKQSNNILPNLRPLVTFHYGENYNFNACMKMLMEYAEPNMMYSYSFFAGITSDNFVQVYGNDGQYENYNGSLSCILDGADLAKYVFSEIGYEHSYITAEQIAANKSMYIETVKAFIDKGLPVIYKQNRKWNPIVGYEEDGKILLYMDGERTEPYKMHVDWNPNDKEYAQDWMFIGAKIKGVDFRRLYINAFSRITELLDAPDKNDYSFGVKAFQSWADDIENGRFDNMTHEQFDEWKYHSIYVCNWSTNFCAVSFDFLYKAMEFVPEVCVLQNEYKNMAEVSTQVSDRLQELEGNFNVTLAALQDKHRRTAIAHEIRKLAALYIEFSKLIQRTLSAII